MAERDYQHAEGVVLTRLQLWLSLMVTCVTLIGGSAAAMNYVAKNVSREVAEQTVRQALEVHSQRPHAGAPSRDHVQALDDDLEEVQRIQSDIRAVQSGFVSDIANMKSSLTRIEHKIDSLSR